jgi:hydrogenase nickel incorporation protein HypA/HybF
MHELGIANSVLAAVAKEAGRRPGSRPSKVGVRIGQMSAIDPEALRFCFEALVRDTELEQLQLEIECVPLRYHCPQCKRDFTVIDYETHCPQCGEAGTQFAGGDELELAYLEIEDNEPCTVATKSPE